MEKLTKKESMNVIEIGMMLEELKNLKNAVIQKIYQPTIEEFTFHIYDGESEKTLVLSPKSIYLSEMKRENPKTPSHFCMFLRKNLKGSRIQDIKQVNNDRILKITFSKKEKNMHVYIEIFKKGNIILVDDEDKIIHALRFQSFSVREIRPGKIYSPPKPKFNTKLISLQEFSDILTSKKEIVKLMAADFGLGGEYAEELCFISNIEKSKISNELSVQEKDTIYKELKKLNSLKIKKPNCVYQYSKLITAVPFEFSLYNKLETKYFDTFSKALDFYFSNQDTKKETQKLEENQELKRLQAILAKQEENLSEFERKAGESRKNGEHLKSELYLIQNAIRGVRNALETMSWYELKSVLDSEREKGIREAQIIKRLIPDERSVVIDTEPEVKVNIHSDISEIMNKSYEEAKRYEQKAESAKESIIETKNKISGSIERARQATIAKKKIIDVFLAKKGWYHQYRWFETSEGNLVIAGKDAGSNENLIKKRMKADDLVFHADIPGSPFGLLRNGSTAKPAELKQVSTFVASYSKAWKMGYGAIDAYYVRPIQLKKAQTGEYVPRGSFVIKGKKNYHKNIKLEISIGIKIKKVKDSLEIEIISGPQAAVKKHSSANVTITPGGSSESSVAKQIEELLKNRLKDEFKHVMNKIKTDDIQRLIPGKSRIFI